MIKLTAFFVFLLLTIGFIGGYVYNKNQSDIPVTTSKEILESDLSVHSNSASCWTVIGGVVYDATNIINKYPAVADKANLICGKDSTNILTIQKFITNQLDSEIIAKVNEEIKKYTIGILAPQ